VSLGVIMLSFHESRMRLHEVRVSLYVSQVNLNVSRVSLHFYMVTGEPSSIQGKLTWLNVRL